MLVSADSAARRNGVCPVKSTHETSFSEYSQRRLQIAERMFWMARKLKTAGVRHHHPDWPEEKVIAEVNRIFLHATG